MSKETDKASNTGMGTIGALGVCFVVLKLCHVIDWSWWYVTLPFWGGLAIVAAIVLLCLALAGLVKLL